jgi:hypothetical protein
MSKKNSFFLKKINVRPKCLLGAGLTGEFVVGNINRSITFKP